MIRREALSLKARHAFLRACGWDVAVCKPGNVSRQSAGHGMRAQMFLDSADACAGELCRTGARVGERIEAAVAATRARVGCNTNLGIILLCAPIAAACEQLVAEPMSEPALRAALARVMTALDVADAEAAYRAIVHASPGGLGQADDQDVNAPPTLGLREAMALAAGRDRIARQYGDAGAELFELGLTALRAAGATRPEALATVLDHVMPRPSAAQAAVVQQVYLAWLASAPDSHIVRKQGQVVAQTVMTEAADWLDRATAGAHPDDTEGFAAWDETLKNRCINPGTSADLTVATLMLGVLLR